MQPWNATQRRMVPRSHHAPVTSAAPAIATTVGEGGGGGGAVHVHVHCGGGGGGYGCGDYGGHHHHHQPHGAFAPTLPGLWPLPPLSMGGVPFYFPPSYYGSGGGCVAPPVCRYLP
jgi:hypothetical protein